MDEHVVELLIRIDLRRACRPALPQHVAKPLAEPCHFGGRQTLYDEGFAFIEFLGSTDDVVIFGASAASLAELPH